MKKILLLVWCVLVIVHIIPTTGAVYTSAVPVEVPMDLNEPSEPLEPLPEVKQVTFFSHEPIKGGMLKREVPLPELPSVITGFAITLEGYGEISLEDYVIGVVAREMGPAFSAEALKAQSICARTFAVRTQTNLGGLKNSTSHQTFYSPKELKDRWGSLYDSYYAIIEEAVLSTAGQVLRYEGKLIEAMYHSLNRGITKNSEDAGLAKVDYLRAVDSHWDIDAPSTYYGHGVGMSQRGAQGMAQEGYTYEEILLHYYTGVEIDTLE